MDKMMKTIQQKLDEGRQYRSVVEIRAIEDGMVVEGYATTFDTPYPLMETDDYVVYEQISRSAFDNTDMADVIMQYDHEGRVFARISNGTLELSVDDHGLHVRADLSGTEIGRQLYEEIRGGYTSKMSFGFTVESDEKTVSRDGTNTTILRTITGIRKLYDVSAVSLPANNATEISARSYCDGVVAELTAECRKQAEIERQKKKIKIMLDL